MADLKNIATILALVDGILGIIFGILAVIGSGVGYIGLGLFGGVVGGILMILGGLFNANVYLERFKTGLSGLILGICVLVVGIVLTTWIGILAGLLFIINEFV